MPHDCKCYARMGNDFWFLPAGQCLYGEDCPSNKGTLISAVAQHASVEDRIELHSLPCGPVDPFRGGQLT